MDSKKKLRPIVPFNSVFYINCYYNSLFPIINFFGLDISNILSNTIYNYKMSYLLGNNIFSTDLPHIKEVLEILKDMGITVTRKNEYLDIIDVIKTSIDNKKPIILFINPYFLPYRTDTFLKKDACHSVLVCGYNQINRTIQVIDQSNFIKLDYAERIITFEELNNAYISIYEMVKSFDPYKEQDKKMLARIYSVREFGVYSEYEYLQPKVSSSKETYTYQYSKNIKNQFEEIIFELESIMKVIFNDMNYSSVYLINQIINIKKVEKYTLNYLLGTSEYLYQLDNIIHLWKKIKHLALKNSLSDTSVKKDNIDLEFLAAKLYLEEKGLYTSLCKLS